MTVGELKELLKDKDDNLLVLRGDNSGGYESIHEVDTEIIRDMIERDNDKVALIIN